MNTYALQVELHFQSELDDDARVDRFLKELSTLASRHGISLGEYQSMRLRGSDYNISNCRSCGHLTVDRADVQPGNESMLPDFWFYVRRGNVVTGGLVCDLCGESASAT